MWFLNPRRPKLSIVVVVYNIAREAPRTLFSLSADYQRNIAADDYEVIVVDNGSTPPFDPKLLDRLTGNFRLIRIDSAPASPVHAINRGIAKARGEIVGVMIDGARIVTPGLLHFALHGARLYPRGIVATLGWYLGGDLQRRSMSVGHDQKREDDLLASIGWPRDGYRLYEIATLDESSTDGWLHPITESNALFMSRSLWKELGGFDERFDMPGGGLVNLDTLCRAFELPDIKPVMLLSEGTFHQFHGGIATNAPYDRMQRDLSLWLQQYETIRGRPWGGRPPSKLTRTFLGTLPQPVLGRLVRAVIDHLPDFEPPLGRDFDRQLWTAGVIKQSVDPTINQLVGLAHEEFRAGRYESAAGIAHFICQRAPAEPEPRRLLSLIAAWLPWDGAPQPWRADYHLTMARAHRLLGENDSAASHYRAALSLDSNTVQAHIGLAELRMPGDGYLSWLARIHGALLPKTYLEIGIAEGASLTIAQPPTRAIGVDPEPKLRLPLRAETHIFCQTSDDFFARADLVPLLGGRPLDLAFIDGLHHFEQALKDFIHVEAHCGPNSVILLHDTIPLDEPTQRRIREKHFYTGDVWKTVLCLKHYRPDLDIITIATPWSGLTIVTGLDATSRVLADRYDEAVARFVDTPYSEIESKLDAALNIVPNDWGAVSARLAARGLVRTAAPSAMTMNVK